jgi:hypothetical protein
MSVPEERTVEDVLLPEEVEGFSKRRVELVQRAVKEWMGALIDLGGRNNLLAVRLGVWRWVEPTLLLCMSVPGACSAERRR